MKTPDAPAAEGTAVAVVGTHPVPAPATPAAAPTSLSDILRLAVERGTPVEALEKLVALHERLTDRQAAQEFADAMAGFQGECPPIAKTSTAEIVSASKGTKYKYAYAELDAIARVVNPLLRKYGLSYSWDSTVEAGKLACVCTLRHVNGHSVTASFTCPVESPAGMSDQQKVAAALTYARRQSLVQVLGLTTCDPDTDAQKQERETITQEQADTIIALMEEVQVDRQGFFAWLQVESAEQIRKRQFRTAIRALEDRRKRGPRKPQ